LKNKLNDGDDDDVYHDFDVNIKCNHIQSHVFEILRMKINTLVCTDNKKTI